LETSIIFPAFVNEYSGSEGQILSAFENNFNRYISQASAILKLDLTGFDFKNNDFLDNEFRSQCISYLFSCSVADILKDQNIKPSFVSGYSMGIYASLYYCGSVAFNDGLILLKIAWDIISGVTEDGQYGMGMIIGLNEADLNNFIETEGEVEICNQNNQHTFIISGKLKAVENVLMLAKTEGALRANLLPVSKPYHSRFLKRTTPEFVDKIKKLPFTPPSCRYVSAIDQQIIESAEGLKKEVIRNLSNRMNWLNTMNFLLKLGTVTFFECGAGDSLTRNARFVEGDFKSFSINKFDKFLEAVVR
jgi:malonyl CoA-acyl carrier protein transacylase